jgi:hypothetical protein
MWKRNECSKHMRLSAVPWLWRLVAGLPPRRPGFDPGLSMWDFWWTKWHWDRFFPEYFGFPLSVSFHRCSITWKSEKKVIFLFIFITGLHNKCYGCGASVASAAGPFTTKRRHMRHIKRNSANVLYGLKR